MIKLICTSCSHKLNKSQKNFKCVKCKKLYKVTKDNIFLSSQENNNNEIVEFHDNLANKYHHTSSMSVGYRSKIQQNCILKTFKNAFKHIPDGYTLDIGCGHGGFANNLNQEIKRKIPYYGVDVSLKQLRLNKNDNLKKFHVNAEDLPFKQSQFNLVYSCEIIQNIDSIEKILSEMSRVSLPGGYVGISTLYSNSLLRNILNVVEFWGIYNSKKIFFKPRTPNEVIKIAEKNGMTFEKLYWVYSPFNFILETKNKKEKLINYFANNFLCIFRKKY